MDSGVTYTHDQEHNLMAKQRREAQHQQDHDGYDPRPCLPVVEPVRQRGHPSLKVRLEDFKEDGEDEQDDQQWYHPCKKKKSTLARTLSETCRWKEDKPVESLLGFLADPPPLGLVVAGGGVDWGVVVAR